MHKGLLYNKMDCLDVLEAFEDNMFSLIYLDIPEHIGTYSERILYDESRKKPIAALCREKGCKIQDLSNEEIQTFIYECKDDREREYEKYLFKIAQNCFRVLKREGVIVYRQIGGECLHADMGHILEKFFHKLGIRVIEPTSRIACRTGFDLVHFYSNRSDIKFPVTYVLRSEERYLYEDERGKYELAPVECHRSPDNYFVWNGMLPRATKGWKYSKDKLDKLYEKGDIVIVGTIPKLKYYREEHPVPASPIWSDKNFIERTLELFAQKGDKVLGIYEGLQFAYFAEKKELVWHSVLPKEFTEKWFQGQKELDGKYLLVDTLRQQGAKEYEINMIFQTDIRKEKDAFYKKVSEDYSPSEQKPKKNGTTTDEILIHYIDQYINRENISGVKFADMCDVSRQTIDKMRKAARKQRGQKDVKGYNAVRRAKETIIKIAIYAQMPFNDIRRALKFSGYDFNEEDPFDNVLMQWLADEGNRDIEKLNEMIESSYKAEGMPECQYRNKLFSSYGVPKGKRVIVDR